MHIDDDLLDGCDLDFRESATADEDVDGLVLYADIDPTDDEAIETRKAEYKALFGEES